MSNEALNGPWQMTRSGVMVPVRGALFLPTPTEAPLQQRQFVRGRLEGPAMPIAARRPRRHVARSVP